MEHYLINQKKIIIEKNKETLFKIPVRMNPSECTIIVENANRITNEELIVTFYLKNIKSEDENKQITLTTDSFVTSYSIRTDQNTIKGEYLLYSCSANKNANIEVSILTK